MEQFNSSEIVYHNRNGKCAFYSYDGHLYAGTFPQAWARQHAPNSGPKDCRLCADIGSWNGVFLGYCVNCAFYKYKGNRGRGLHYYGKETKDKYMIKFPSIFDTYLKDVCMDDIGDITIVDTASIIEFINPLKSFFIPENTSTVEEYHNNLHLDDVDVGEVDDIDYDIVNAFYDELATTQNKNENKEDEIYVGFRESTTFCGGYDGGYESY